MQSKQVQQLLPVVEKMELNKHQMLVGIIQTNILMVKVTSLVYFARVVILVVIEFLFPRQFLMDRFVITME
jgi:positive regulator of sigma E activity